MRLAGDPTYFLSGVSSRLAHSRMEPSLSQSDCEALKRGPMVARHARCEDHRTSRSELRSKPRFQANAAGGDELRRSIVAELAADLGEEDIHAAVLVRVEACSVSPTAYCVRVELLRHLGAELVVVVRSVHLVGAKVRIDDVQFKAVRASLRYQLFVEPVVELARGVDEESALCDFLDMT